ncbi:MAG: hypothetical protein A2041_14950 [Bacteroidetes bacterium GWA2_31_9b]|nr:MAG: hypothetical protein A2041_14950 [Bacteroidetes bacterium GWA2_31_9b]
MNQVKVNHKEFRQTYLGAAPHSLTVGSLWIISGIVTNYTSTIFAILFFFFATAVNFPIGEMVRKLMKIEYRMNKDNNLDNLFTWLSLTIPLSIPLVFMACQNNMNWFFPAFTVLVGAHYLPFVWAYQMPTFGILGILMVVSGSIIGYYFSDIFDLAAYTTGGLIILFGIIHLIMVKKEIKNNA